MRYFIYLLIENLITRPQRVIKNLRSFFREKKKKKKKTTSTFARSHYSQNHFILKENTILRVTGITTEQKQKQQLQERVAL